MAKCIEWKELENTITIAANRKEIDCETWARAIYSLHDVQKGCCACYTRRMGAYNQRIWGT